MITKKALTASAKARKAGAAHCRLVELLRQGERAYYAGLSLDANPHSDPDDASAWSDGWHDAAEQDV